LSRCSCARCGWPAKRWIRSAGDPVDDASHYIERRPAGNQNMLQRDNCYHAARSLFSDRSADFQSAVSPVSNRLVKIASNHTACDLLRRKTGIGRRLPVNNRRISRLPVGATVAPRSPTASMCVYPSLGGVG
jgi:hypothetical protein